MANNNRFRGLAGRFERGGGYGTIAFGRGSTGSLGTRSNLQEPDYDIGESPALNRGRGGTRGRGPNRRSRGGEQEGK